jgi:hypothetical protein
MSSHLQQRSELFCCVLAITLMGCGTPSQEPERTVASGGAPVAASGGGGNGGEPEPALGPPPPPTSVPTSVVQVPPAGGGNSSSGGNGGSSGNGAAGDGAAGRMVTENCAMTKASAMDIMTVRPADIIFAIDSSSSMDEEIAFVQTNMNAFSQQISASGIDAHVIMIADDAAMDAICIGAPLGSGTCPDDSKLPNYAHIPVSVGSHDALDQIVDTFPMWRQHLRPEATKSFVVVTDDDAPLTGPGGGGMAPRIVTAQAFVDEITALDPMLFAQWTFNGVYCFTDCAPTAAAVGQVYIDLVARTMGVGGDLCLQNFQPVFDQLAKQIITNSGSTIACEWALPAAPTGQSFAREFVKVDRTTSAGTTPLTQVATEAACATGGWHFDHLLNPTKILACPNTCMEMQNQSGGKIEVSFGCEAVGGCVPTAASTIDPATLGSCTWDIPKPPQGQTIAFESVNVRYFSPSGFATNLGKVATQADCASAENGWYYDNETQPTKILACPQTCTGVQAGGAAARIEVLFGCKTRPAVIE